MTPGTDDLRARVEARCQESKAAAEAAAAICAERGEHTEPRMMPLSWQRDRWHCTTCGRLCGRDS